MIKDLLFKNFKRLIILWITIMACCAQVVEAAPKYPPDIERIKQRGSILVAIYGRQEPPYIMRDKQGNLFGFDIDLVRLLAKRLRVKLIINSEAQYYNNTIDYVVNNKADIAISSLSRTLGRAEKIRFSVPYMRLNLLLLINRVNTLDLTATDNILEVLNHNTTKLAVLKQSSREYYAENLLPRVQMIRLTNMGDIFDAVMHGAVNAALVDNVEVETHFKLHPENALWLQAIKLPDNQDTIGIAVNYQDLQLLSWINLFIETIAEDNNLAKLQYRYMEDDAWIHQVQT